MKLNRMRWRIGWDRMEMEMQMDEILDIGSRTRVAFDLIWLWKALDVESSGSLFFWKVFFLSFDFILLITCKVNNKEIKF